VTDRRHFGSVRKLPSKRWQAAYWHEGVRHTASETFPFKADAQAWLSGVEADILRGGWVDPTAGRVTVKEYSNQWLDGRSDLRESTRSKYRNLLDNHILDAIGAIPVGSLMSSRVRSWYHELAKQHQVTADDAYRLLRAILNTAVADSVIVKSPCQIKGAGQVNSPERPTATLAEVAKAVESAPERWRLAFLLAAWCQLRRGELLGLRRGDVDLMRNVIKVERAWVPPMKGKAVLGAPKTEAGRRTVAIPPNIVQAIEDHLDRFVAPSADAWLFATRTGTPLSPRNFKRARAKAPAGGRSARSARSRPSPHRAHLGRRFRRQRGRTDAPSRARIRPGGDGLPARHRGPGSDHR
jgi:integrase